VRRRLLALAALAATSVPAPAASEPPESPSFAIPESRVPVGLDGTVLPAEWEEAASHRPGPEGLLLRVKQSRGTLLVALETGRPWPAKAQALFLARPGAGDGKAGDPGTYRLDFEPWEHDRPHAIVSRRAETGWVRDDAAAVVRTAALQTSATFEAAIPFSALGLAKRDAPPLRWLFAWFDPTRRPTWSTVPQGLDVSATPGGEPPDFRTTARWAETIEWHRPDGPGAFPSTEWAAWVQADRALAERGAVAHDLARRLRDDGPGEGREEPSKQDGPVEERLLGNLRWIAEREPLTPTDLRAAAVGLWKTNRYDAAIAGLEGLGLARGAWRDADAAFLRARVAHDAERFEEEAAAWEEVARRAGSPAAYRNAAAAAREKAEALAAEREARRADEAADLPLALLRTAKGSILVRLLEDDVPQAVAQFVHLVEVEKAGGLPFYDGTLFHRVVPNRFAQGGDPKSRTEGCEAAGDGGAPWFVEAETNARHGFFRGAVAFAHRGDRKNRGQFFVVTGHPEADLASQGFTCFGTVVAGQDVAERLEACDALLSVEVVRKRAHAYEPKKQY
jgi:cyclophilin family peptidyl-prolyl cis-trans isomerase